MERTVGRRSRGSISLVADGTARSAVAGGSRGTVQHGCRAGYKVVDDVYHLVKPDDFKKDTDAIQDAAAMLRDDESLTTIAPPAEGHFVAATLSLDVYRTGHLLLDIAEAAGDEIIDVIFAEELEKSQLPLMQRAPALRYRCRPGAQRWESFAFAGMQHALVVFRNVENAPLKIRRIAVRQVHAALESAGSFQCSDERLTRMWEVGRQTQLNCSFDALVDCPGREQAMWWGDARVQAKLGELVGSLMSVQLDRRRDHASTLDTAGEPGTTL